jgi:hypothetical protein
MNAPFRYPDEVLRKEVEDLRAELQRVTMSDLYPFRTNTCPACGSEDFANVEPWWCPHYAKRWLVQRRGKQPYFRRQCNDCGFKFKERTKEHSK